LRASFPLFNPELCHNDRPPSFIWLRLEAALCFGDFELLNATRSPLNCTLVVVSLSKRRTEYLLSFLQEIAADLLKDPVLENKPIEVYEKKSMEKRTLMPTRRN